MQNSREIRAAALRRKIEKAFASVSYPGDENITRPAHSMPGGRRYRCDECMEIAQIFRGKKWQDWKDEPLKLVGSAVVEQGALSLFKPEAFQYYLPLFLIAATAFYEKANLIPDNTVFAFRIIGNAESQKLKRERFRLFSEDQLGIISACLQFLKEEHEEDFPAHEVDDAIRNIENELRVRNSKL
jgi:hypothetical protein